ncbi:hypothetical protein SAMN05216389_107101 [Oceanobacillus limi]|uniref:Uncharacterized protein n=1 Tax=Oceanobacillus limi TaxID=930131 RepID=A0A1I0CV98_9BACI|nr:hypothetical protein [Oceanobacillus limi]SET23723.1 hypothetical protein SAMN05216389_107101 [Oceanobacillus limi]
MRLFSSKRAFKELSNEEVSKLFIKVARKSSRKNGMKLVGIRTVK